MNSNKKSQHIFAHSPSLQILWKCAGQRRLVTKTLIQSIAFKNIYHDVLQYVQSKHRRRSPLSLILDSHLMIGLVYVYSRTVFLWHQDVEKLYKDAVVHRFFEFEAAAKSKLTRKKETILTTTDWQIEIDENLLPDERILLERDFSIEIPRQPTPPIVNQSPDNLPLLPWEVSRPTHGKRITLLPDIEEQMPKFDLIDDRFGEPLPIPPVTSMDIDQQDERTFFRPSSEDRSKELLRAPFVDRHLEAVDRYIHPSHDRTVDENHPARSAVSDLPPLPMPSMDITTVLSVTEQFTADALAFFQSSLHSYPTYSSSNSKRITLLGASCTLSTDVPMIVIQEPTMIGVEEPQIPMDTMPPFDQQIPSQPQQDVQIDAQVPAAMVTSDDEKEYFHISKKTRNTPNALNKVRKYPALYENIVDFDYEILKTVREEHDRELEQMKREKKPWPTLVGRNGTQRMKKIIENSKKSTESLDLRAMFDDIMNIANMITNPDEPNGLAQARLTGEEIAIRRGQSSGLLPKTGTRSPSIVPIAQDRVSQIPIPTLTGDVLPTFPSGFDDASIAPLQSEPVVDIRQPLSPIQTTKRDLKSSLAAIEPSPILHDKQKQKAIDDILSLAGNTDGMSLNEYLKLSHTTRIQAARLFSVMLVLSGEQRIQPVQNEPYGLIHISIKQNYSNVQLRSSNVEESSNIEPMDADIDD